MYAVLLLLLNAHGACETDQHRNENENTNQEYDALRRSFRTNRGVTFSWYNQVMIKYSKTSFCKIK